MLEEGGREQHEGKGDSLILTCLKFHRLPKNSSVQKLAAFQIPLNCNQNLCGIQAETANSAGKTGLFYQSRILQS